MTNASEQVLQFIRVELEKLRDEIYELKRCQIDFIRLATIIFGLAASVIAALTPYLSIYNEYLKPVNVLLYIAILSVIGLVYPYIIWIIIHKCRSIFRIVAYIRLIEELVCFKKEDICATWPGYERLHRKLKEHKWLAVRIFSFENVFERARRDIRSYKHWIKLAEKESEKKGAGEQKPPSPPFLSVNGLGGKGPYIGDYYGKLLFFIKLLWAIASVALLSLSVYATFNADGLWIYLFGGIGVLFLLWIIYHLHLSRRYLLELRYRPFSIDAYYDMWKWALENFDHKGHGLNA